MTPRLLNGGNRNSLIEDHEQPRMMLYFCSEGEAMDNHFKMEYGCHICQILTLFQTIVYMVNSKYSLLSRFTIFIKKIKYSLLNINVCLYHGNVACILGFFRANYCTFQSINKQLSQKGKIATNYDKYEISTVQIIKLKNCNTPQTYTRLSGQLRLFE